MSDTFIGWETIGIKEDWIGQGMTETQMMQRIQDLGLPAPPFCSLSPYYLNYMQVPDANQSLLQAVVAINNDPNNVDDNTNAWIANSNLWTPGQTINIGFANSNQQQFIQTALQKYLQPNISMNLVFVSSPSSADILITVQSIPGAGGMSNVGKVGSQQNVQLGTGNMSSADISILTGIPVNSTTNFNWAKYTVLHEFGHAMGLQHEWLRSMCNSNGVTCSSTDDAYSVLNYPPGSVGGDPTAIDSPQIMDEYSLLDRGWLNTVYKGPGTSIGQSMPPPGTTSIQLPPGTISIKPPLGTMSIRNTIQIPPKVTIKNTLPKITTKITPKIISNSTVKHTYLPPNYIPSNAAGMQSDIAPTTPIIKSIIISNTSTETIIYILLALFIIILISVYIIHVQNYK